MQTHCKNRNQTPNGTDILHNQLDIDQDPGMLSSWSLRAVHPNHLCKAIVRCGLLYTLECADNNVIISAVYDFYTNRNVNGRQMRWRGITCAGTQAAHGSLYRPGVFLSNMQLWSNSTIGSISLWCERSDTAHLVPDDDGM
ncbi:hypothetical protein KIN20_016451 [Parelaphostrongylus tenuis]|uniref:Uncharacterized protein n=1 Tax=Parelaphostrongylus tenuis TaxID=148309 RepID=A0AAD5QQQ7_PARTN|nr:hypothetical protein KIN20_016451 [Parelaphostrongylus tenuis]